MENPIGKPDTGVADNVGGNNGSPDNASASAATGPTFIDPASLGGNNSAGGTSDTGRRKRGRPRGPSGGKETGPESDVKRAPFEIDGVSAILLSIHQMLAGFTAIPEMEIEKSEADRMASALKRVADLYDVKPTEKTLAWTNLATATAMIYGNRVFAYRMRKAGERATPVKSSQPQNQHRPTIVQ